MEGSGPPPSQELVHVREDIATPFKTLFRLYTTAQEPVRTQIFDIIWDLAKLQGRLKDLSEQVRASEP